MSLVAGVGLGEAGGGAAARDDDVVGVVVDDDDEADAIFDFVVIVVRGFTGLVV